MLVKMLGGSHSYGLNGPNSDLDYRGVFLNTELRFVLGLDKYEHYELTEGEDVKYKELRRFLQLLKVSNTEAMEIMFTAPADFLEVDPLFLELQKHKYELLDTDRAFKCLCGYMQGEKRLMLGERSGQLGSKRKEALEKFGYSYKNAVQLLRLSWAGTVLFKEGIFPVNVVRHDPDFGGALLDIKRYPQNYTKEGMSERVDNAEAELKAAYDNRKFNYKFNQDLANDFVLRAYYPLLREMYVAVEPFTKPIASPIL